MANIKTLFKYAFNEKFDPFPKLTVSKKEGKYCILDIDGTLNSPNSSDLLSNTLTILSSYKKRLRKNLPEIYDLINKARNSEKEEYIRRAESKILECNLHKSLIYSASKDAAENFSFVRNFYPALIELKELEYNLYLVSGSFDPAVNFLAQRFPKELDIKFKGSSLKFDDDNILDDIETMIGKKKAEYVEKSLELDKIKVCIFVTDDMVLDKELIELGIKYDFPTLIV
jgi:phosphoserine phosphatase